MAGGTLALLSTLSRSARRAATALAAGAFVTAFAAGLAAQDRRAEVAVTAGSRHVTVGEIEDRISGIPRFQLLTFGDNPDAIKRKLVDEIIVPDLLLALGAEDQKLDQQPLTAYRLARARGDATLSAVRTQVGPASAISADDVRAFYEANRSRYDAPERYLVWRILCESSDEANEVLAAAKKDPSPAKWTDLAREHSLDKGTYLQGGNLGFVSEDGVSNEAGLRVDPVVVKAAETVKDGELVPQPVAEGDKFGVVWRRGTIGASHRTVDEAAAQIRQTLWQQRVEAAQKKLLDDLRKQNVKEENPALLEAIDISASEGVVSSRHRRGQVPPAAASK